MRSLYDLFAVPEDLWPELTPLLERMYNASRRDWRTREVQKLLELDRLLTEHLEERDGGARGDAD